MFCLSARLWMDLREFRGREREQKDPCAGASVVRIMTSIPNVDIL